MASTLDCTENNFLLSLRERYVGILRTRIVNPLRDDILRIQASIQQQLSAITDNGDDSEMLRAGLEAELEQARRALRLMEIQIARVEQLGLRDLKLDEKSD